MAGDGVIYPDFVTVLLLFLNISKSYQPWI